MNKLMTEKSLIKITISHDFFQLWKLNFKTTISFEDEIYTLINILFHGFFPDFILIKKNSLKLEFSAEMGNLAGRVYINQMTFPE